VVAGPGGIFVELLDAAAQIRLPHLGLDDAHDMLQRSSVLEKLRAGFRGRQPADRTALLHFIVDFARFVEGLGDEVVAVDLNPVMVLPRQRGLRIVDALFERTAAWKEPQIERPVGRSRR
jgi:ATP-dependent exoDNAse (exonuclease V) alpha subunit